MKKVWKFLENRRLRRSSIAFHARRTDWKMRLKSRKWREAVRIRASRNRDHTRTSFQAATFARKKTYVFLNVNCSVNWTLIERKLFQACCSGLEHSSEARALLDACNSTRPAKTKLEITLDDHVWRLAPPVVLMHVRPSRLINVHLRESLNRVHTSKIKNQAMIDWFSGLSHKIKMLMPLL